MASYNGAKYIREQLDSLYNQTLLPDEIVVCDDNSTDGTIDILDEYHKSKGLKYYVNNPGLGVNANFYRALSLCTSDYIMICDQDDIWYPRKVEITYKKLLSIDDGKPSVVSSQYDDGDASGNINYSAPVKTDSFGYFATLMGSNNSQGCTMMLNRPLLDIVMKNKDKINGVMYDGYIGFTAAILGNKYNLGEHLMIYRHHQNNVVAKETDNSIIRKIQQCSLYRRSIPEARIDKLANIYRLYKDGDIPVETRILLDKIERMSYTNSFYKRLLIIMTIQEYSVWQKVRIFTESSIIKFLRIIIPK